jgi:AcrR family transcriptional regulator
MNQRRRGTELETALLDAAWAEVQEKGYAGFTMDAVAQRAGTSRPVLYRRWPNRARLVHAAMRAHIKPLTEDVPDTGQLRTDVIAVLEILRGRFDIVEPAIVNGLASELDQLPDDVLAIVPAVLTTLIDRAVARGEMVARDVPAHILAVPAALLRHDLVLWHRKPTDAELARIVDDIFLPLLANQPARD